MNTNGYEFEKRFLVDGQQESKNQRVKGKMEKENHKIKVITEKGDFETLADILPPRGDPLKILFIAKTPAPESVSAGHYFQGRQGKMLWNKLAQYNILHVNYGEFEDDHLLENNYGLTDIVKVPRSYGNEPSDEEYRLGLSRIMDLIRSHKPEVLVFVYKKPLDQILKMGLNMKEKSFYGFNPHLELKFGSKVFVFPMPGTPCNSGIAHQSMVELKLLLEK